MYQLQLYNGNHHFCLNYTLFLLRISPSEEYLLIDFLLLKKINHKHDFLACLLTHFEKSANEKENIFPFRISRQFINHLTILTRTNLSFCYSALKTKQGRKFLPATFETAKCSNQNNADTRRSPLRSGPISKDKCSVFTTAGKTRADQGDMTHDMQPKHGRKENLY